MIQNNPTGSTQFKSSNRKKTSQNRVVRDSSKRLLKKVNLYPLFIPNNIDLDDLLSRHPIAVPNARDKIVYLLHLVHAVPAFKREDNNESENGFTTLYSIPLQSVIDDYASLFNWLRKQGIIEVDNSYILNEKSKGYRFSLKYRTKVKKVYITTWTLIRRIMTVKRSTEKESSLQIKDLLNVTELELKKSFLRYSDIAESRLAFLKSWFNDNLTIDEVAAYKYLDDQLNIDLNSHIVKFPMRKYNLAKIIVESLAGKIAKFHIDNTSGRLHTLLTCLKSELRAFLKYAGKQLSAIDIKNSQPVLSISLLDYGLFTKNRMMERIKIYNQKSLDSQYYIMLGDLIKRNSNNSDTQNYRILVLSGTLYFEFGKKLQEMGILSYDIEDHELRAIAKQGLLKCLFNSNHAIAREKIQWAFKQTFPSVYEIFEFIKKYNYKTLACVLQNLEAEIVLHKACSEIALNYPDIPLFTIHDSIATTQENISVIKKVLSGHLFESLGNEVMLEEEIWDNKYFDSKSKKKQSNVLNQSSNKSNSNAVLGYGYFDYNQLLIPYLNSLTKTANELGLRRNKFIEGLRSLNILSEFNLPLDEFEKANLLIKTELRKKIVRKRSINIISVKVTDEGLEYLRNLADMNPDLFPKKRKQKKIS